MHISTMSFKRNNIFSKKNQYASKPNFSGKLENDYFEASKTQNIQKQIKSISNYSFNITEKDIETNDNFLHVALKSNNKQLINKALILLGQKDANIVNKIIDETNNDGKRPYDYISDAELLGRLETLVNKKISVETVSQPNSFSPLTDSQIKNEKPTQKLNELPAGTVISIPDDDDDDDEITLNTQANSNENLQTRDISVNKKTIPLEDIAGLTKAKDILIKKIVLPIKEGKNVKDSGFLLHSATKCGKSFLLRALAKSLDKAIIDINKLEKLVDKSTENNDNSNNEQDLVSKILSENIIQVSDVQELETAVSFAKENYKKTNKQSIIFIDEIKGLLPDVSAASSGSVTKAEQLIEDSAQKGFVIIATTRRKDEISPDSIRAGRFDKKIELKLPTKNERKEFIDKYLNDNINSDTYTLLLNKTAGFSYKDIENIIEELNYLEIINRESVDLALKTYAKENNLGELSDSGTTANYDSDEFRRAQTYITFKDVAGMSDVKEKFKKNLINKLTPQAIKWSKENGNRPPVTSGYLLYGPPGTGKTFIAEAVAGETKIPLYKIDTGIIKDKFVGESEKKINKLFNQLETKFKETGEYSILLIDEANSLLANRKKELSSNSLSANNGDSTLVDLFLQKLNNAPKKGIIPIAITNYKDEIDDAILDRLQTQIEIQLPDDELREALVKNAISQLPKYTKNISDKDIKEIVIRLGGFSSRTISAILEKALNDCSEHPDRLMTLDDFTDAIKNYAIEHDLPEINENNKTSGYDGRWKRKNVKFPANFADVAGMDEVKKIFNSLLIDRLKPDALDRFKKDGNRNPIRSNFLLYGPPGTGKTFIAEALAGEMKIPLYQLTSGDIKAGLYGESEKNINSIFDQLEKKFKKTGEYSILFVDEANDLFRRADNNGENSLINLFLQRTNNSAQKGIIVIAATNYKDQLEGAMLSRLGQQIYIGLPDKKLRKSLIEYEIRKSLITKEITDENINELIELLNNYSSRDISGILQEAINKKLTYSSSQMTIDDFKNEIETFMKNRQNSKKSSAYINELINLVKELNENEAKEISRLIVEYKTQNNKN